MGRPPSADFAMRVERIANLMASQHPDERLRTAMARQPIEVWGSPTREDYALVRGAQRDDGVLVGYHVPKGASGGERIAVFENGVKTLATTMGISVDRAIETNLAHEAEHSWGFCPPGHTDCSESEIQATLAAGGTLDPEQTKHRRAQFAPRPAAHWTYEALPELRAAAQFAAGCG